MTQRVIDINENSIYADLCNDALVPVRDGGFTYKTALHAYYMYLDDANWRNILTARSSTDACAALDFEVYKNASSIIYHARRFNFLKTLEVMRSILFKKVIQNPRVKRSLLLTGDALLVVMNGSDMVLGTGKSRRGLNLTGLLLMEIRDHFRGKQSRAVYELWYSIMGRMGYLIADKRASVIS